MTESDMTNDSTPRRNPSPRKLSEMDDALVDSNPSVEQDDERMFWIGIGASAGGLEALRELVSTLPKHQSTPATYIVAQHLSPKHQSMMVQLVERGTPLSVRELENGTVSEPNVMYVTPPNSDVFAEDGVLYLRQPISQISPKPSVDNFFTSLAESAGDHAIGIILSGTGSDGAHGMRAIRAVGGLTIAQEPITAKYDGMPKSAIETGCVDLVLPLKSMAQELFKVMRTPNHLRILKGDDIQRTNIQELLHLLKERHSVDFKDYKTGTLYRRINRRMAACNVYNLNEYLEHIHKNAEEVDILFKDIMISVTNFFRDADCFGALKESITEMVRNKAPNEPMRVWVPGCATGEEAYSIAILFAEACGGITAMSKKFRLQIFATDIDTDALTRARKGIYPEATLANVEVSVRERYFRTRENAYEITKPLRDLVVFSRHNVFEDPPFLRMDLIACRNLLIYFNAKLQHSVLSLFHYAMQPDGVLFLGKSESLGHSVNLFQALDSKHKLYKRKLVSSGEYAQQSRANYASTAPLKKLDIPGLQSTNKSMHDLPDAFIEALSPDSLLIDKNMDIIRVYGDVHAYTQLSPGGVSMNLLSLARKEFRQELRALVFKIIREQKPYTVLPKKIELQGKLHEINIIIRLLHLKHTPERLILVSFEKIRQVKADLSAKPNETPSGAYLGELEQELAATKEHLQTVVEELETSNEELQSTNEELQSSNEELQSSNEELETANEELQSTNEELLTVNEELHVKTAELASTNEDLNNIKESIDYPILVVNKELKTTRFNKASKELFALADDHQGEALTNVVTRIDIPHLRQNVESVIKKQEAFARQLDFEEFSYLERITPYRNESGRVDGAILTYVNNTSERKAQAKLAESENRFQLAVTGSSSGIWDLHIKSGQMYCSPIMFKLMGIRVDNEKYTLKQFEKRIHPDDLSHFRKTYENHLIKRKDFNVEFRLKKGSASFIWVEMRGQAVWDTAGHACRIAGSLYDITERVDAQIQLSLNEQKYRMLVNGIVDCGVYWLDSNGYINSWNKGAEKLKGYSEDEIIGKHYSIFFTDIDKANKVPEQILTIATNEGRYEGTGKRVRKNGEIFSVHVILDPILDESGTILGFAKISRDVTERERLIEKLTESNIELESFAYAASHDLKAPLRVIDNASRWLEEDLSEHLDQESLENMQLLRSRVARMGKLLDDMLEYSLIGSKMTNRPTEMIQGDLLIKDVLFLLAPPAGFSVTYGQEFQAAKLPKFFIQRVLMNLISNAIKHHDKKEGHVSLSLEEDEHYYTILVEDNGPGIAPQFHTQVFKMFHTLKPRDKVEGSGMGLAMVKKQVEHFGGTIMLESEEGKGCRFRFSWPKNIMSL